MSSIQLKATSTLKKPTDNKLLLDSSYVGNKASGLRSSSSAAQFASRGKALNMSFQLNQTNGLELSFSRIASKSPVKVAQKKQIRNSKSVAKNCRLNNSEDFGVDPSAQQNRLESIYLPDKKHHLSSSSTLCTRTCSI